jgi:glycosyltransferase involved in cell wall biosynthesis
MHEPRSLDDSWPWPEPDLPHVLLVVDQFPASLGGGERTVLRLAELLPRYGYRASVLTFAIHPQSSVLATPLSFPLYLLPLQRTYDWRALQAALALGRFLRRQKVVLVETFFESSDLWAGCVTKALSRAKLVWSRRDMGILRGAKHRLAYRMMARLPDRVFAVSDRVRRHCIEVDGVDSTRVRTIYNGLDLQEAPPRPAGASRRFHVTTIGNIRRVKGHDVLIRAAALVVKRTPEIYFSIAGEILEADYFAELISLVDDLGLSRNFQFAGGIRDPGLYLEEADIFVLPSRSEGFSNALLEAMAAALPIIATDVGGNAEAVLDGCNGLLIPPDDPNALARCIARLVDDRAASRQMGAAGRRLAEEKFSTAAMMAQVTSAYAAVLHAHAPLD